MADDTLDLLRAAEANGMLDKINPAARTLLAEEVQPALAKERQEALKSPSQIEKESEAAPKSFVDRLFRPVKASIEHPVEAGVSVARGLARSYLNPLPIVNLVNKANPFANEISDDLETFEAYFNFPVIRGAELLARMTIPESERPDLTTFAQVANGQRQFDTKLRQLVPGIQEGTEAALVIAGTAQLASQGLNLIKKAVKEGPSAVRAVVGKVQQARAASKMKSAETLARKVLQEGDGPVLDAILQRPEKVKALLDSNENLSMGDIALQLEDELTDIAGKLGETVGKYRDVAYADTTTRLNVPKEIPGLFKALRDRTTFDGETILPPNIDRILSRSERAASLGVTNPNQTMVWIKMIDDMIDYKNSGKPGAQALADAEFALKRTRGALKNILRQDNKVASEEVKGLLGAGSKLGKQEQKEVAYQLWANADEDFSNFSDSADGVIRRLKSDSSESLVDNLFRKNNTPLRTRLAQALDYMDRIDPTARGYGNAFFEKLANVKAALKIKDVEGKVSGLNRVTQEAAHEIVRRWTQRGQRYGGTLGAAAGAGVSYLTGGMGTFGLSGAGGYFTGRALGAEVGQAIGQKLASTERVLNNAIKAKNLSKQAKELAGDMLYITKTFGPEGNIAFLDIVGPIPALKELTKFTENNKSEEK